MFQLFKKVENLLTSYNTLYDAIIEGNVQKVRNLITDDIINKFLWKTYNPLSLAVSKHRLAVVIFLLENGAESTEKQPTLAGELSILEACIQDEEDSSLIKLLTLYAKNFIPTEEALKNQKLKLDGYLNIIDNHKKIANS